MPTKDRLSINIDKRLKRRLKDLAKDRNMSMNDMVLDAIRDYVDNADALYQNQDIVLDRLNQVLISQLSIKQQLDQLTDQLGNEEDYDGF